MPDTSGPTSPAPLAFYDPESSSWRTSQATLLSDSMPCSVTLPRWGSMRSGALYERPMLAPATSEPDCSSSLPTPRANASTGKGRRGEGGPNLQTAVAMLPTPLARDAKGRDTPDSQGGPSLPEAVFRMLPTPTANDAKSGANATAKRRPGAKHNPGMTLTDWGRLFDSDATPTP